jgi:phage gpG-like protein
VTGDDFLDALSKLPDNIAGANYAPALSDVALEVYVSVERNFSRQVDQDGVIWPPRKDNLPHPLLILTGAMLDASTGGVGAKLDIEPNSLAMGVESGAIPYAAVHQFGFENIPRRQYFYLNENERPDAVQAFGKKVSGIFRELIRSRVVSG